MRTRLVLSSFAIAFLTTGIASCAQPEKAGPIVRPAAVGTRFNDLGKVTLHRGQPCTSQIMFDFHGARSKTPVGLAVNAHEEKILVEAANKRRRVHVAGKWERGRARGCVYVSVSAVEVPKSKPFWQF